MSAEGAWEQNRNSSKAWLALVLVLFLAYGVLNILRILKKQGGKEPAVVVISPFIEAFLLVMERDMMPVFIIFTF